MVTAITVSFALAFEKVELDAMKRPPRPANTPLLNGYFLWRIFFRFFNYRWRYFITEYSFNDYPHNVR
ncbi:MAG: cation transporting ATPase C-terminal domain-containing protein [Tannerellaceae bacterium]|nr:cation transporting ATPase C-terminal domain-containing protein [Tannerellaceae bacterium]